MLPFLKLCKIQDKGSDIQCQSVLSSPASKIQSVFAATTPPLHRAKH